MNKQSKFFGTKCQHPGCMFMSRGVGGFCLFHWREILKKMEKKSNENKRGKGKP
jgi:hypothetical protein